MIEPFCDKRTTLFHSGLAFSRSGMATMSPALDGALAVASKVAESHLRVTAAEWWAQNGHIGQVGAEVAALRELAMDPSVKVACEVGFNVLRARGAHDAAPRQSCA